MSIIDFKEIPPANSGNGDQDSFELFARDFVVEILGLKIISQPNRGADGGKDFLAEEIQSGTISETHIRWLVSCKHFAHSGKSVSDSDEQNILDRVHQHKADGFIGFYSTIASSGLGNWLDALKTECSIAVFDRNEIERHLFNSKNTMLLERYFPNSFSAWKSQNKIPALLLSEYQPLPCAVCGKDLLLKPEDGLILFVQKTGTYETHDVVGVCRGHCDEAYDSYLIKNGYVTAWEDISDFIIPPIYLKKQMAVINNLFYDSPLETFTEHGIEAYKSVLIALSQLVFRERTEAEWKRTLELSSLPEWI